MLEVADLTATATLILAGITLSLVIATIALVWATRAGTAEARRDAKAELDLLQRQIGAGYRPLLVDVLTTAPVPPDMGAIENRSVATPDGGSIVFYGQSVMTTFPVLDARPFDPRFVFVALEADEIYVSVPLRNVGRGLAVIDPSGVELVGALVGKQRNRIIQRFHVPVGETTRIDLIARYLRREAEEQAKRLGRFNTMAGTLWQLVVPYVDFAGQQRTIARLQIICQVDDINGLWLVARVEQLPGEAPAARGAPVVKAVWWGRLPGPVRRFMAWWLRARRVT